MSLSETELGLKLPPEYLARPSTQGDSIVNKRTITIAALVAGLLVHAEGFSQTPVIDRLNTTVSPSLTHFPIPTAYFVPYPGQVALATSVYPLNFLTATGGGDQTINALTTSGTVTGYDQRFTVQPAGSGYLSFVTLNGYYVLVQPGVTSGPYVTQTAGTGADDATLLKPQDGFAGNYSLETYYDYFLYFPGNGAQSTNAVGASYGSLPTAGSDAGYVYPQHCGDLGSGYKYRISYATGEEFANGVPTYFYGLLQANDGGGLELNAIGIAFESSPTTEFTFIQQPNGSYALQTSNGTNYVTAVDGGGLSAGNNLATNRTEALAWEEFVIKDIGDCLYTIQTVSGYYIASPIGGGGLSTDISVPGDAPSIGYSAYFVLRPVWN
jgi:hypothetical protein